MKMPIFPDSCHFLRYSYCATLLHRSLAAIETVLPCGHGQHPLLTVHISFGTRLRHPNILSFKRRGYQGFQALKLGGIWGMKCLNDLKIKMLQSNLMRLRER